MGTDLDHDLDVAVQHHGAGRIALAEAGYVAILEREPDQPDALNLLGLIRQGQGRIDAALALLHRALELDPEFPEALTNLARTLRTAGRPVEAIDAATRAVSLDASLGQAQFELGAALLDAKENEQAAVALRASVRLMPQASDAHARLATALLRLKDYPAASDALLAALAVDPNHVECLVNIGLVMLALDRPDEALRYHEQAAALAPLQAGVLAALADTLRRRHDSAYCAEVARRALALEPNRLDLWLTLGSSLCDMGQFDEAEGCFRRLLELDPQSAEARHGLSVIRRQAAVPEETELLATRLADPTMPLAQRIAAGFALGSLLDQAADYDQAFAAYAEANRLSREWDTLRGHTYDAAQLHREVSERIAVFQPGLFVERQGWGDPSELPVFIVGMPRSGTTLVEQIAASHPSVFGAGERKDMDAITDRLSMQAAAGGGHPGVTRDFVRLEAAAHIEKLHQIGGAATRVIDKMPDNVRYLGEIALLFPNSRIVLCRRDLRDVCLSCHFQKFADNVGWNNDLADCAERAREIERLTQHWKRVLPLRVLEVRYEELVANLEGQSRRLIDFLGLPWDSACLRFHEKERAVLTASRWQVRQPVYSSSVGRWRNYRQHLGPLLRGLAGIVPED